MGSQTVGHDWATFTFKVTGRIRTDERKMTWNLIWANVFKQMLRGSERSITRGQAEVSQATIWQGCQRPVVLQVFHKPQNHLESLLKQGRLGPTPEFLIQGVWDGVCSWAFLTNVQVMWCSWSWTTLWWREFKGNGMSPFISAKVSKARPHFCSMSHQVAWIQCCPVKLGFFPAWGYLWW